jgi:hypothetical protein
MVENVKLGDGKVPLTSPAWVPPPSSLLALKVSHVCFTYNWEKTAEDIVSMLAWFKRPLDAILQNSKEADPLAGPDGPDLSKLIEERVCMNAAVNYSIPGFTAPQLLETQKGVPVTLRFEEAKDILQMMRTGETILVNMMKELPKASKGDTSQKVNKRKQAQRAAYGSDTSTWTTLLQSRFLPFVVEKHTVSEIERNQTRRMLIELIALFAIHYYLNSGRVTKLVQSGLTPSAISQRTWRAAIRTLCTNCFAELIADRDGDPEREFRAWFDQVSLYDHAPHGAKKEFVDRLGGPTVNKGDSLPNHPAPALTEITAQPSRIKIPTPSQVEAMRIPFRSALVQAILSHFHSVWTVPPFYETFIESSLGLAAEPTPLPTDVWQNVATLSIHDHVTLNSLACVNKALNQLVTESRAADVIWDRLLKQSWEPLKMMRATSQAGLASGRPRDKFKAIFQSVWRRYRAAPVHCGHCDEMHQPIPREVWMIDNGHDYTQNFCACPGCGDVTGSWDTCPFHYVTII